MKLLGWMHQKLCRHGKEETGMEAEITEEQSPHDEELFHGFLTIGTLGSGSFSTEPPTPMFPMSFDIGNEVELINNELEKFLSIDHQAKEYVTDDANDTPRSSIVSIITLSNTQGNDADSAEDRVACFDTFPLQKYLFGSSEVSLEKPPEKKLFKFSNCENSKKKPQMHLMMIKNIVKKLTRRSSASNDGKETKSGALIKRKLPKVLKLKFFHKKVHADQAEGLGVEKPYILAKKDEIAKVSDSSNIPRTGGEWHRESVPYSERITSNATTAKSERWITTDDDYLVLELQSGNAEKSQNLSSVHR